MIRTIDELAEAFAAEDFNKDTVLTDIKDTLADQKLKYTTKDKEVLKYKSTIKSLGYNKDEHGDLDTFANHINELKSKTITQSEASTKLTLAESRIKELELKEQTFKRELESSKLQDALNKELGTKLKGSKYIVNDLINSGKVKLVDGDVVFMDGDVPTLFANGIEKVLKENEELLLVDIKTGSDGKGKTNTNKTNLTLESINKLTREQAMEKMKEIRALAKR